MLIVFIIFLFSFFKKRDIVSSMRKKRSSRHFRQKKKFSRNLKVKEDAKDMEYLN